MPHAKAVVAGRVIAETDDYEVVEGNIYVHITFPADLLLQHSTDSSSFLPRMSRHTITF